MTKIIKIDIKSMDLDEIGELLKTLNQPKYRARQIYEWLHIKLASNFEEMTNLPKELINSLKEQCNITVISIEKKLVSKQDGTVKYLFKLNDDNFVETVLMKYKHGNSICISTQVGCKMGCKFCASTKADFIRNLNTPEILEQVYAVIRDTGDKISNIVLMGIGEPLDNYDNVIKFLRMISNENGLNLSMRHISLSTCGLVDKIYELAELKFGITLSISLHATNNESRSSTMPINKRYNIEDLIKACKYYTKKTSRRISFEYALINGVNDSKEDANALSQLLKGMLCHVNLIPVNQIKETDYKSSKQESIMKFQHLLVKNGINATIRRTLGADIDAACGQLRRENIIQREGLL